MFSPSPRLNPPPREATGGLVPSGARDPRLVRGPSGRRPRASARGGTPSNERNALRSPGPRCDPWTRRRPWRWSQHDGAYSPTDTPSVGDTAYAYTYTPAGRTESLVGPEGEETDWGYVDGFLDYESTVGLYTRTYGYDVGTAQVTGWVDTSDTTADTRTVALSYTGPKLTQRVAGDGATTEIQSWGDWDAYGTARYAASVVDFTTQAEEIRTTDGLGRLSTTAHTIAGSSLGTVSYGYNANGSLSSVETSWAGGYTLHRGVTGLVDEVRDSSTAALLATIDGRDALGRVTHAVGPDGTETSRAYDAVGRTTWSSIQHGLTLDDRQYTHDLLGRVEQVDHVDADGAWSQYFEYESPGRLIGDKRIAGGVVTSHVVYAWDAAGNRTSVTRDGVTTALDGTLAGPPARVRARRGVSPLYTFWRSAGGEPDVGHAGRGDDGAGGQALGRGLGVERGAAREPASVRSDDHRARWDTRGAPGARTRASGREVWGNPGADLPLAGDGPEGDWLWIAVDGVVLGQLNGGVAVGAASDPLGSIAYYDGALAGVPEAFGEGSGISDVRHGWAGMETLLGTPYQLAQHRLYDTANGRFTTADPIGLAGGDHRYAYGGGDPVQFVDPSGLAYVDPGSTALSAPAAKRSFEQQGSWQQPSPFADLNEASAAGRDAEYLASLLRVPVGYDREQGMPCVGPHCGRPDEEGDGTGTPDPRRPVLSDNDQERGLEFDPNAQRASIAELLTELWGVVTGTATEAELSGRNSALVVVVADRVVAPAAGGTGAVGGRVTKVTRSAARRHPGGGIDDPFYRFIDGGSRHVTAGALGTVAGATRFAGIFTRGVVHDALAPVLAVQEEAYRLGLNDESYLDDATEGIEPPFNDLAQQMETTAESLDPEGASWAGMVALTGLEIAGVFAGEGGSTGEQRLLTKGWDLAEFARGKLEGHFTKHAGEWGAGNITQAGYLKRARSLLGSEVGGEVLGKVRANGDVLRYNLRTNELAVGSGNGTIRTLFRPDPQVHGYTTNLEYFYGQ